MAKVRPMWGAAIRKARRATGLTQAQLAVRLGRSSNAVMRWEMNHTQPPSRQRRALVREVRALDAAAGDALEAAFAALGAARRGDSSLAVAVPPTAPLIDVARELERALFELADELDVPARRARGAVLRFLGRLSALHVGAEQAQRQLDAWVQAERAAATS